MLVLPVCGTLRGAGEEKVGGCFDGVLVDGVGVAMMVAVVSELDGERRVSDDESRLYRHGIIDHMLCHRCWLKRARE